jgi:hypothetical protein
VTSNEAASPPRKIDGAVISVDPLVTFSKRQPRAPLGLASAAPEAFAGQPSLHLVGLSWAANDSDMAGMKHELAVLRETLPLARFVVLANDTADLMTLAAAGFTTIPGSTNILIDDTIFRPGEPEPAERVADAIYNARFMPFKQHRLCANLRSIAFIYFRANDPAPDNEAEVRRLIPHARYLNHEAGGGVFRKLSHVEIAGYLNRTGVGLCLSSVEGQMRASMEYMLCGLPVVTVPSKGGRDRYLLPELTVTCDAEPAAVERATYALLDRAIPRATVRAAIEAVLAFERRIFLNDLNMLIERTFKAPRFFEDLTPIIASGALQGRLLADIIGPLMDRRRD